MLISLRVLAAQSSFNPGLTIQLKMRRPHTPLCAGHCQLGEQLSHFSVMPASKPLLRPAPPPAQQPLGFQLAGPFCHLH